MKLINCSIFSPGELPLRLSLSFYRVMNYGRINFVYSMRMLNFKIIMDPPSMTGALEITTKVSG